MNLIKIVILMLLIVPYDAKLMKVTSKENKYIKRYCGLKGNENPKFKVVGKPAAKFDYLWSVHLDIKKIFVIEQNGINHTIHAEDKCSGTLISTRHIITNAHCLYDIFEKHNSKGEMTLRKHTHLHPTGIKAHFGEMGAYPVKLNNYYVEAKDTSIPGELVYRDFAFLELQKDVTSGIEAGRIRPICFTDKHSKFPKQKTVLAGYGHPKTGKYKGLNYVETTKVKCPDGNKDTKKTIDCYRPSAIEPGDSGAGFFMFDKKKKAHLTGVARGEYFPQDGKPTVDEGVRAVGDNRSPMKRARQKLNLNYVTGCTLC